MKLSVVIPSYKDPLLHKTIDSLLANSRLGDQLEINVTLDGYWPTDPITTDSRVNVVHLGRNRGMRDAINAAVDISKGEYLMRVDEHQTFCEGYDEILTAPENIKDNWIVTPRRYFLNTADWEIMDMPPIDYMKLKIAGHGENRKFTGVDWPSRAKANADKMIDQTMAMQGSCWVMKRSWWDEAIGELQTEGYGPLYQDSHEMQFKTWKKGGKLVVNKKAWHAHKHRDYPRTHNNGTKENPSKNAECFKYSLSVWEDYYTNEIRPIWKI